MRSALAADFGLGPGQQAGDIAAMAPKDQRGESPADELLAKYMGAWNGDLTHIYREYSY